jgi:hypothetical protein
MKTNREFAYQVDPAVWMQAVLGITPHDWQRKFLLAPLGASIAVLTARQVGKTTAAAVGMAHSAWFMPGSLSVIACPSQNQSAEALHLPLPRRSLSTLRPTAHARDEQGERT